MRKGDYLSKMLKEFRSHLVFTQNKDVYNQLAVMLSQLYGLLLCLIGLFISPATTISSFTEIHLLNL